MTHYKFLIIPKECVQIIISKCTNKVSQKHTNINLHVVRNVGHNSTQNTVHDHAVTLQQFLTFNSSGHPLNYTNQNPVKAINVIGKGEVKFFGGFLTLKNDAQFFVAIVLIFLHNILHLLKMIEVVNQHLAHRLINCIDNNFSSDALYAFNGKKALELAVLSDPKH
ncbi:ORF986 [White spot syndrome virus]|uniref:ORF986 n=1 Tax=White spot syndrome virus TaxID=342409 RepID=A0A2D3I531_9VIRU|nr:ORF986 [White spot syndrome virus]